MLVREAMAREPVTTTPGTSIKHALAALSDHHITAMPVVDGQGELLGIVSEADLIQDVFPLDPRALERPITIVPLHPASVVEDVYTRAVATVAPDDDVANAVEVMRSTGAKSLPVVDAGRRVVGMVSRSAVVRALARDDETIASDVTVLLASVGHHDWAVEVEDGAVRVTGPADPGQVALAHMLADTVAGVVSVSTSAR